MNCQKCGNYLLENEQYCGNCGAPISSLNSNPNYQQTINYSNINNNSNNDVSGKYKLTLHRKKSVVGSLVSFRIYIDNQKVGKIKNGETLQLEITNGNHQISINENNPVNIIINGDTTADIVAFGYNNFGITNICEQGKNYIENKIDDNFIKKNKYATNFILFISSFSAIFSIIMILSKGLLIRPWIYGFFIGYALINIAGLKNIKNSSNDVYKSLLKKNILAIVICIIVAVITIYFNINVT